MKIQMKRSEALRWIKLAIEREQYINAIGIVEDLIVQEEEYEKEQDEVEEANHE